MAAKSTSLKLQICDRIDQARISTVWTPIDFIDLGNRDAIDKTLQRLAQHGYLQRIDRGLYTKQHVNFLTKKMAAPDYQKVIEAICRRAQIRVLVDGMSAANILGLTTAVPAKIIVHTDGRLRPIHVGNITIQFKLTAPSKLYWADHPAMYVIQALYWLGKNIQHFDVQEQKKIENKLLRVLLMPGSGEKICHDILNGLHTVPAWMQKWLSNLIQLATTVHKE